MTAGDDLAVALRRAAWQATAEAAGGIGFVPLARLLGVRVEPAWQAVAWLLEAGYVVAVNGRLHVTPPAQE